MGQSGSCIQGTPDWLGPYEKSGEKSVGGLNNKELYDRLSELILLSSVTNDYSILEEMLLSSESKHFAKNGPNEPVCKLKGSKGGKPKPAPSLSLDEILTGTLHKETQCKSVNFSNDFETKEAKSLTMKQIINNDKCLLHGHSHKQGSHAKDSQHVILSPHPCSQETKGKANRPQQTSLHPDVAHHKSALASTPKKSSLARNSSYRGNQSASKSVKFSSTVCRIPSSATEELSSSTVAPPYRYPPTVSQRVTTLDQYPVESHKTDDMQAKGSPSLLHDIEVTSDILGENVSSEMLLTDRVLMMPAINEELSSTSHVWLQEQMKLTAKDGSSQGLDLLSALPVQSAKEVINHLEDRAEAIVETFGVVLKHLEHGDWSTFCISTSRLCDDIRKVLKDYRVSAESADPIEAKVRNHVTEALNQLTGHILNTNQVLSEEQYKTLLPSFRILGEALHELMEFLITRELEIIVESTQHQSSTYCVKMATCALAEMALSGSLMCHLITEVGGVQALLDVCMQKRWHHLQAIAMRALTMLCNTSKAATKLELAGGLECIIAVLSSSDIDETTRFEAIGLLAQVLKQWTINGWPIQEKATGHLNKLVKALIDVAQNTVSSEAFLLAAASLTTLASLNPEASLWLKRHESENKLFANPESKQETYV